MGQQNEDLFRFANLTQPQIDYALQQYEQMGINPRGVLTQQVFDTFPVHLRQQFFQRTSDAMPAMTKTSAPGSIRMSVETTGQDQSLSMRDLIMGGAPAETEAAPSLSMSDLIRGTPEPMPAATVAAQPERKVGKVSEKYSDNPLTQFGRSAASLFDVTLGGIAPGVIEPVTYAGARAFGKSPAEAKELSTSAAAPFESPMGRTFGITETPEYQNEATRKLFDFVGENLQKGSAWIAEKTGLPVQDVENMMGTVAAGAGVKTAQPLQRGLVRGADVVESALGTAKPAPPVMPKVEPAIPGKPRVSYADFQAQLQARQAGGEPPVLPPAPQVQTATMPAPTLTQPFPEIKYAPKGIVNLPEQEARKQILARIGLQEARESSIVGDGRAAANEFVTSNLDNPAGDLYKNTLANERATLENFGQKIVERTGGTLGLDEDVLYNRGTRITRPFDDFKTVLQNQMNRAYEQARQVAGNQPAVSPANLQKFLNTDSNFTVNDSFMSLRRGIESHLRENDLLGPDGKIKPMTVEQAENLRKYINSNWNNERSGIIGRLKDKIDNDVTKVAGEDVYKNARDIRTKIARLLDDPKGVSKIMDYDPQSPMNRAVPFEKIATTVERMSVDQQRHLIKLLQDMPDEVRPQAQAAIAEIKAQFANRILQEGSKNKGQWNAANVTKYLNDNNRRLGILMDDPEIAQMVKDLSDAGHILKYDSSYPGAAVQAHNLIRLGAAPLLGTLGTSLGGAIGGGLGGVPGAGLGATVGGMMGAKRGVAMAEKSALKRAKKKMIPLKDIGQTSARVEPGTQVQLRNIVRD